MTIDQRLASKIRHLRQSKGLTQEDLAELSGLAYKYIQRLEGRSPPSPTLRTLLKLAKAFRIEAWELIKFHLE